MPEPIPLDPDVEEMQALLHAAEQRVLAHLSTLQDRPCYVAQGAAAARARFQSALPSGPVPIDAALDELPVTGPARAALEELRIATGAGDAEAANALALLHRLAGGAA